jgi:hypothetical protein
MLLAMTEDEPSAAGSDSGAEKPAADKRRGPPPNPLYHPLFLPVLMVGFMLWFFWDGFITTDPEMLKHQTFNRVLFGVTLLFSLRFVPRGIREFREERAAAARKQTEGRIP